MRQTRRTREDSADETILCIRDIRRGRRHPELAVSQLSTDDTTTAGSAAAAAAADDATTGATAAFDAAARGPAGITAADATAAGATAAGATATGATANDAAACAGAARENAAGTSEAVGGHGARPSQPGVDCAGWNRNHRGHGDRANEAQRSQAPHGGPRAERRGE